MYSTCTYIMAFKLRLFESTCMTYQAHLMRGSAFVATCVTRLTDRAAVSRYVGVCIQQCTASGGNIQKRSAYSEALVLQMYISVSCHLGAYHSSCGWRAPCEMVRYSYVTIAPEENNVFSEAHVLASSCKVFALQCLIDVSQGQYQSVLASRCQVMAAASQVATHSGMHVAPCNSSRARHPVHTCATSWPLCLRAVSLISAGH